MMVWSDTKLSKLKLIQFLVLEFLSSKSERGLIKGYGYLEQAANTNDAFFYGVC